MPHFWNSCSCKGKLRCCMWWVSLLGEWLYLAFHFVLWLHICTPGVWTWHTVLGYNCHCYFYNPPADQQACHHPLRPDSLYLEQSLRLHQEKSAACIRAWRDPQTISKWEKKKKPNKRSFSWHCSARQEHSLCSAASLCPASTLLFSQRSSLAASSSGFLAGNPTCLRLHAPRLHPRAMFSPTVNCY